MDSNFSLKGKTALVTGASSRLGQGMTVWLARARSEVEFIGVGTRSCLTQKERLKQWVEYFMN